MTAGARDTVVVSPSAVVLARGPLAALVGLVLRHCGLLTRAAVSPSGAIELLDGHPALLIVHVTGPASRRLLTSPQGDQPILALIDVDRGESSFRAFADGADQVVRVPFTPDELAIRAGTLLRRCGLPTRIARDEPQDGLTLSLDERADIAGRRVPLDPQTNSLLYLLAANRGRAVSRRDVRELVWGVDRDASDRSVDHAVRRLRDPLRDRAGRSPVGLDRSGATLQAADA